MKEFNPKKSEDFNFKEILYSKSNWVATITINRPQVYNAYSIITLQEMISALQDAAWDDGIAVIVLTGAGDKAFCAGGDVKEYASEFIGKPRDFWKWMGVFTQFHDLLRNVGKPTIARLNGIVAGGGNEINMSCDLAIAADHVVIKHVGTSVGSVAAGGATQFLPILTGDRRAREILFLNEPISAQKALEWGLVNYVVPMKELDLKVLEITDKLINKFPECTRYTKQQLNFWKDFAWNMTIGHAKDWLSIHFSSYETHEGMQGFVEKRPPDYLKIREKAKEGMSSETMWGANLKECENCGTKYLPAEFNFCGKCGAEIKK
ncbi:MAG TPA: enoyl-CoA hydratase-related protein [Candidatus Gastranaerophilales bacterium]|nr:enoyl-CoA hydratase-related protein [Candidatus Gastranaerophilales bacterium]